jgi:hypothetical protein
MPNVLWPRRWRVSDEEGLVLTSLTEGALERLMHTAIHFNLASWDYAEEAIQQLCSWEEGASLTIQQSCGEVITYNGPEEVPRVDTPCPCGKEGAWVIRWEVESDEQG